MLFIPCDTRKIFFMSVYRYSVRFFQRHVIGFFGTSTLKEARILCYLQINSKVQYQSVIIKLSYIITEI